MSTPSTVRSIVVSKNPPAAEHPYSSSCTRFVTVRARSCHVPVPAQNKKRVPMLPRTCTGDAPIRSPYGCQRMRLRAGRAVLMLCWHKHCPAHTRPPKT